MKNRRNIGATSARRAPSTWSRGRRPAGYVLASVDSKAFDDPGVFVEIPVVNQIRREWLRMAGR
jgi:hypothetical protein